LVRLRKSAVHIKNDTFEITQELFPFFANYRIQRS